MPVYTELVTVRRWSSNDQHFINPHENVQAYWLDLPRGGRVLQIRAKGKGATTGGVLEPGSQVIFSDGTTRTISIAITSGDQGSEWRCRFSD